MPTDASEFTLSLFDNTALPGWTHHAPPIGVEPCGAIEADADDDKEDGDTPSPAAPATRGSNFHLAGDRGLARAWPTRARDNIAAIGLSKAL
jgi:hypothetical protein